MTIDAGPLWRIFSVTTQTYGAKIQAKFHPCGGLLGKAGNQMGRPVRLGRHGAVATADQ